MITFGTLCPLQDVPLNYAFSPDWDGRVNGEYIYAPRKLYERLADGRIRDIGEFGRTWDPADCGFTAETVVRVGSRLR